MLVVDGAAGVHITGAGRMGAAVIAALCCMYIFWGGDFALSCPNYRATPTLRLALAFFEESHSAL